MANNRLFFLRFGIKRKDGCTSSTWTLFITKKGDVYLTIRNLEGKLKWSFHESGECLLAFTKEHKERFLLKNRLIHKWNRLDTPTKGSKESSYVAFLVFPSDYLSRLNPEKRDNTRWISAAPSGNATCISMLFTAESKESVVNSFTASQHTLISYTQLSNNNAFFMFSSHTDWKNTDLRTSKTEGIIMTPGWLFSENDPDDTGRPIRLQQFNLPNNGEAQFITELGGYTVS
jgi:hypothetical protein